MEVKRLPPCPDYDIRGTEHWLEEMAAKGYRLCRGYAFQYGFAYFVTEPPRKIRYRLVPIRKIHTTLADPSALQEEPDEDTVKFHRDFGWEYVTYRGQFWIFSCEDPHAPELDTDPQVQAIALKTVEKRLRIHLFTLLLYGLIMNTGHRMSFFATLCWAGWYAHVPKGIFLLCAVLAWLPGLVHIVRFRKQLKQGIFPDHTGSYSRGKTLALQALRFSFVGIWIIASLLLMPDYTKYGDLLTPELAAQANAVTAADLFPDAEISYISKNNVIYTWQTDAADSLKLIEGFRLTFPDGTTVSGQWKLCRYETSPWIAAGYARETRFVEWLRGGTEGLSLTLEEANWARAFRVDRSRQYVQPFETLLIQKDGVFYEASLILYGELPNGPTREEIATLLLKGAG